MSDHKHNGGPAFPREDYQTSDAPGQSGMSLRDYFAAKALQGIEASQGNGGSFISTAEKVAERAYTLADAMLTARQEQPK